MLPTFCPPTIWTISLEFYRKPSILAANNFLGACYRKAMTPKKLWTLLFLHRSCLLDMEVSRCNTFWGNFLEVFLQNPRNFSEVAPEVRPAVHTALLCFNVRRVGGSRFGPGLGLLGMHATDTPSDAQVCSLDQGTLICSCQASLPSVPCASDRTKEKRLLKDAAIDSQRSAIRFPYHRGQKYYTKEHSSSSFLLMDVLLSSCLHAIFDFSTARLALSRS